MITNLKIERVRCGITQLEVSQRTRISPGRLSLLERGIVEPSAEEAERLGKIFGVTGTHLFREIGPRDPLLPAA